MRCWNTFLIGYIAHFVQMNATQSWIGKEKYIAAVEALWTNDPWWVWPGFFALLLAIAKVADYLRKPIDPYAEAQALARGQRLS